MEFPSANIHRNRAAPVRHVYVVPPAWRALAALGYLSGFIGISVFFPIVIWLLYPRSRYLRTHALNAGFIQMLDVLVTAALRVPSYLFLIEEKQFFMTPEQYAGALFSADQLGTIILLVLLTAAFITFVILPGVAAGKPAVYRRLHPEGLRATGDELMLSALLAAVLTPVLFYMQGVWGGVTPGGDQSFFGLNLRYFENPYRLFPGHVILLWCMTGLIVAVRGKIHLFPLARRLFVLFQREAHSSGRARYVAARRRALLVPGWGQFFAGHYLAGAITATITFLVALFLFISIGLNYGRLVEDIPGLNANFAWHFLTQLGMRSHVLSDGEFRQAFGNWLALGILGALVLLLYLHSWYATRMIFRRSRFRSYFPIISHSVLLHLIPVAVLLIIPVTVIPLGQSRPPGPDAREQKEPEPGGIPRSFEQPEDRMDLSGARSSGEEGEQGASRSSSGVPPVEILPLESLEGVGPRLAEDEQRSTVKDLPPDEKPGQPRDRELVSSDADADEERPLPGKRQKQTYSNYLSVKIRAPEKDLRYWDQMPQPYSAVFEYRIDAGGLVHSVRVLEPSGHSESDRLTVQLIESMGTVLPPPGERDVLVTELFWNTGVDDPTLPTGLQRQLSREFDGRVIEPLQ